MPVIVAAKKRRDFDPKTFLVTIGEGRKIVSVTKRQAIYAQGAVSDSVFYILSGKVKLTVVATDGKEATLGILNPGDFLGEGCLAGQPRKKGDDACASLSIEVVRFVYGISVGAEHPIRRGFGGPTLQFQ
jgi:CRP-like cAMP-binding protein